MVVTITGGPAYGLSWNKTGGGAVGTRLASAVGLTAGASFDAIAPWTMRRCNLWDDGTITAYYGDRCFTHTDVANMGQVMVQIPKFYYNAQYDAGTTTYYWYITLDPTCTVDIGAGAQTVAIHPAFNRGGASTLLDGVTKDYIYVGAFEAYLNAVDSKLESKANVTPTVSKTIAQFRTAAQLRKGAANYWEIQDYLTTAAVQMLYLIEYAGFNSQTLLSVGLTQNAVGAVSKTGWTSAGGPTGCSEKGNASGQVQVSGADYAMSYRGIENFYGNIMKVIDGINIKADYKPWIANHAFDSTNVSTHPYLDVLSGDQMPASDGTISDIKTATTYGFLPAAVGGAASTYLCDAHYRAAGLSCTLFGGKYSSSTAAGMFCMYNTVNVAGTLATTTGSRLMYIGGLV